MYFFDAVKDNIIFFTSSLPKLTFDTLNANFGVLKADASQTEAILSKNSESSFNTSQINIKDKLFEEVQETRVFCIVNKYNELVKASSRLFYSSSIKSKPIYCLFLSKQDAIDFLYKIANTESSAFKRAGLGLNSFSLKEFFKIADQNKNNGQIFLISDLQEIETFMKKSKFSFKDFNFIYDKNINSSKSFNGLLAYRINPQSKDSPFSNKCFLKVTDAVEEWYSFSKTNPDIAKNLRKPTIQLSIISQDQLRNILL